MKAAVTARSTAWQFACPVCHQPLGDSSLTCTSCVIAYEKQDYILSLLSPDRRAYYAQFLREYTHIRMAEGRVAQPASYFERLPKCDPAHPMAWQWGIRSCTVKAFDQAINLPRGAKVLDLGSGCGWFSNHLAKAGHLPCAIDVTVDDQDGLGAARHYGPDWPCVQAEFDGLPFPNHSVDAIVFNASLHYSTNYTRTLSEALRVLRPGGSIIVLETPIYKKAESGARMAAERHQQFEKRYGTRSDSVPSIEYLTWDMLRNLGAELNVKWQVVRPWYGWKWAMRPWIARWKRKREPSQFAILIAKRKELSGK